MQFSTGLINSILDSGFDNAFSGPVMDIMTGPPPSDADSSSTGAVLCTISLPAPFLGAASNGAKSLTGAWSGNVGATGEAGWFRIRNNSDAGSGSTTLPRIDGTLGESVGDIILSDTSLVAFDTVDINSFSIASKDLTIMNSSAAGTFI